MFVDRRGYLAELFVCEGNSSGNCGVRKEKENTQVGSEGNANVYGTRYNVQQIPYGNTVTGRLRVNSAADLSSKHADSK